MNHICNNSYNCFSINYFDLNTGDLYGYDLFDSIFIGNNKILQCYKNHYIISSHDEINNFNKIKILKFDPKNDSLNEVNFLENDSIRFINDGILFHNSDFYVWGEGRNINTDSPIGHIVKVDSSLNKVLDTWYFSRSTRLSPLSDLQIQPDGSLAFLINSSGNVGQSVVKDSILIVKIDINGNIINEVYVIKG